MMFDARQYQKDYRATHSNRIKFYNDRETARRRESKNWCLCCGAAMIDPAFVCEFCKIEAESDILSGKDATSTRR